MNRKEYQDALTEARAALIEAGYCGPSDDGPGDDEVNAITKALNINAMLGNLVFNVEQCPAQHSVKDILNSIRSAIGLTPGERP